LIHHIPINLLQELLNPVIRPINLDHNILDKWRILRMRKMKGICAFARIPLRSLPVPETAARKRRRG
jgi:hypothetical protein